MKEKRFEIPKIRWVILAVAVTLGFGFLVGPAMSADGIDPDADKILQSMSSYLGGLSAFSMSADIDNEIVDLAGQKLQLSSGATIIIERPGNLYIHKQGAYADVEFLFNGKVLTLYGKGMNAYMQINSPGNTDNAIVVVDNIHRHRHKGQRPKEGAIFGANEVGVAVIASTLTTKQCSLCFLQRLTST